MSNLDAKLIGSLTRNDFPDDFLFGSASSSFQYEGAPDADGRLQSIWDTFLKEKHPEIVAANGLDAIKFYYRYKTDIMIMKEIGLDTFRFSISWPRILPKGRRTKGPNGEELGVNQLGIDFYNNLINTLLENGIVPNVTLFHWDLPQALEDEYLGFLCTDERIFVDFVDYADLCFREFGDRVKFWLTVNETWTFSLNGYLTGVSAPGRGPASDELREAMERTLPSNPFKGAKSFHRSRQTRTGDPTTEPYKVAHNQLLAHAAAVKLYRTKYQGTQKGKIGLGLVSIWAVPLTATDADRAAAQRTMDFMLGWIFDPVVFGKYPDSMRSLVGDRLPKFTDEQVKDLVGSYDFIGMNYYTTNTAANYPTSKTVVYNPDSQAICDNYGEETGSRWVYSYPEGLYKLLLHVKEKYNNPIVYITENGVDQRQENLNSVWDGLFDVERVRYLIAHLKALNKARLEGANVKGYYHWSLLDNLEWRSGFESRFGMNYVHFENCLERYPKISTGWYKLFLEREKLRA